VLIGFSIPEVVYVYMAKSREIRQDGGGLPRGSEMSPVATQQEKRQ